MPREPRAGALPVPPDLERILREPRPAVVATLLADGAPVTDATWYGWLGDAFLLSMDIRGYRARRLRRDGRASLTVLGEDWRDQVTVRGTLRELRPDPDYVDLDGLARRYGSGPYPRSAGFEPLTAVVAVTRWSAYGLPSGGFPGHPAG